MPGKGRKEKGSYQGSLKYYMIVKWNSPAQPLFEGGNRSFRIRQGDKGTWRIGEDWLSYESRCMGKRRKI